VTIRIPPQLADAVDEDDYPERLRWLAALPRVVEEIAAGWELELGEPYLPGGQCAWVAPACNRAGEALALKVGWRHREAEHEADALRHWDGHGAVRCLAARSMDETSALLLERCTPGHQLKCAVSEPDQDVIIAGLLRCLWERLAIDPKPFIGDAAYDPVQHMLNCDERLATDPAGLARRMAALLDLDPDRVRLWLFARCAQESLHDPTMRAPAQLLAP
jgi:streptomycin 6-kinase